MSGLLPSLDGNAGMQYYQSREREEFFIIHENGKSVFDCDRIGWPGFLSLEVIVFPKSKEWSMVFSHEQTMHYVEPITSHPLATKR